MKKQFKKKNGSEIAEALKLVRAGAQKGNRVCQRLEAGLPNAPRVMPITTATALGYGLSEAAINCTEKVALFRLYESDSGHEAKFSLLVDKQSCDCLFVDVRHSELANALKEAA